MADPAKIVKKRKVVDDKQKLLEHLQLRPHAKFAVGSDVEVTSDEEGFRGIWFPGKLISMSSKKHKTKYLVEYKTLLDDESLSEPLVELFDASHLRIRPALAEDEDNEASFEVNDVVEAYHCDGWWVGVVIEVFAGGIYRLFFNNPPEEMEFERSSLRLHKDWVDGRWVRPEKQDIVVLSDANKCSGLSPKNSSGAIESVKQEQTKPSENPCVTTPENIGIWNERFCIASLSPMIKIDGSPARVETTTSDMEDNASMENVDLAGISTSPERKRDKPLDSLTVQDETLEQNDMDAAVNAPKILPFTKTSPIWKVVESMEVFRQIPQNPDFQALYETRQDCREGIALGHMITFSGLVEKISGLHSSDPKTLCDDSLVTLSDLERQGFNVDPIRAKLKELISIKWTNEIAQTTIDDVKKQIEEKQGKKQIINEERTEIDKRISELLMKRELVDARDVEVQLEIDRLQSRMESVKGEIEANEVEFEKVVMAPW